MRILDKYIINRFIYPFFYCVFVFIFLYIIIDLFGQLDEILKHKVPILILCEYYISMIPFIILWTAPVAALISTMYVLSTMNKSDEITAMRAAGISLFRILAPFLCIGLVISISVFGISEKFLPKSMGTVQRIKTNYIEKENSSGSKNKGVIGNIVCYGKNNRLIFIKSYDHHNKIARHITILQQDKNGNVTQKINSEEGKWTGSKWILLDTLTYNLDTTGMITGNPVFLKGDYINMDPPEELISKGTNYEFMSFKGLADYIPNFSNASPDIIQKLRVDLHQKLSIPFISLVLILIGAGFGIKASRRGNAAIIMGISMVIGFIYYGLMAMCIALGKGAVLPPVVSAHLANIIFGLIGIFLIAK